MHNQLRELQPYEDCQAKSIQEFGWTSQVMDWGWGSRHQDPPHTDVSRNLATVVVFLLLSHSWTTDNIRALTCKPLALTWAKEKNWTVAQWSKVLFSDESKFCISFGNVSVTYVTLVPWRRERRRHVRWPTKLGSCQRDQSTSSVTKRANGHWHAIIASSCRWSQREYKRQQVHRINSCFRWGAEPVTRQLSGGTATVVTGRDVSVPSFRERGLHT